MSTVTTENHSPEAPHSPSPIRAFTPADVPAVADLWQKSFQGQQPPAPPSLRQYFHEVFFENPWQDSRISSLVYLDRTGQIAGFLGALPRPMIYQGQRILAAVATQLMVDPQKRCGFAATELLRTLFAGPQDLTWSDGANPASLMLWKRMGGDASILYSLDWTRVLRPISYMMRMSRQHRWARVLRAVTPPLAWCMDAAACHAPVGPFRTPQSDLNGLPATDDQIFQCLQEFSAPSILRPVYEPQPLRWLLAKATEKKKHGDLRKIALRDHRGEIAACYLYYVRRGGVARVLQIGARPGHVHDTLDHLFVDARIHGAVAVSGQMLPSWVQELSDHHCRFRCLGLGVLIHSKDRVLLNAIHRGDAFLTRLDGEQWLRFGGGEGEYFT